jgi:aminoglycoside 6-adenylyltransferase
MPYPPDRVVDALQSWSAGRTDVRAALLTSSRAVPGPPVDALSDYDDILVVDDIRALLGDRGWLAAFGDVLVAWWDPVTTDHDLGVETAGAIVQYADGLKVDVTLWPVTAIDRIAGGGLTRELDAGYRVLYDPDGLATQLPAPSFTPYRVSPPDAATWEDTVTGFLAGAPYVAKCLVRGDLLPARWCLDVDMTHTYLVPMLQWWVGCHHGWDTPAGNLGKGLQRLLPPEVWDEVEDIWAEPGPVGHATALFRVMALFRRAGIEVGQHLGMPYPTESHDGIERLARRVLDRRA